MKTIMETTEKPERKLNELFDEGFKGLENVTHSSEATNSSTVQAQVRRAISALEDCTRLVSAAGMFSSNEALEEVSSTNVRYLLLPALLGRLTLQIAGDASGRLELVLLAEAYFKDFLRRCRDYEVVEHEQVSAILDDEQEELASNGACGPLVPKSSSAGKPDLAAMVNTRNAKIRRHQARKELEKRLDELKVNAEREGAEDELVREYHTTLLKANVGLALDELSSLAMEKDMLQHMARLKKESLLEDEIPEGQRPPSRRPPPSKKPLRPVIITRDDAMKQVFGAGYPSLPVMTVAEFYEERVKEGVFPGGCSSSGPSHSHSHGGDGAAAPAMEDGERELQERQEEEDDPELLARRRAMDEFKDDHRRGEGNRYNRS